MEAVEEREVERTAQAALDPAGAPFDPATEPSLVKISEELAGAELELRHLRIKAQGQPTDGGATTAEQIPDAEKEVGRLEQEYEAEAQRVREAKEGVVDLLVLRRNRSSGVQKDSSRRPCGVRSALFREVIPILPRAKRSRE